MKIGMEKISRGSIGSAVEDVQRRLARIGFLQDSDIDGVFGDSTANAVRDFCCKLGIEQQEFVDDHVWSALVDATFELGDRTLYLRMPYYHGKDVEELQQALGALGFPCGGDDGIFGAHTEDALRKFQLNMLLPADGIAGGYTFDALRRLHHSWFGKEALRESRPAGFARASDVLERHAICLYGTDDFTCSVASRISNIALATNPASHIVSADALSVAPDSEMLLVEIALADDGDSVFEDESFDGGMPVVKYGEDLALSIQLTGALARTQKKDFPRIKILLPGISWMEAGPDRTAQHYAITLLDALCAVL